MPGQTVNVLEVPAQSRVNRPSSPNGSSTSIDDLVFTLDPKDKYVPLGVRRAFTTSEIRRRRGLPPKDPSFFGLGSSSYVDGTLGDRPETATSQCSGQPLQRQRPTRSVFAKLRRSRSAGSGIKERSKGRPSSSWSRRTLSRAGQSLKAKAEEMVPAVPKIPENILSMMSSKRRLSSPKNNSYKRSASEKISTKVPTAFSKVMSNSEPTLPSLDQLRSALPSAVSNAPHERPTSSRRSNISQRPFYEQPPRHGMNASPANSPHSVVQSALGRPHSARTYSARVGSTGHAEGRTPEFHGCLADKCISDDVPAASSHGVQTANHQAEGKHHSYAESSAFSFTPSEFFSPNLTSNTTTSGRMSPIQLSQPPTPQMTGFDDDTVAFQRDSASDLDSMYGAQVDLQDHYFDYSALPPSSPPGLRNNEQSSSTTNNFPGYSLPRHEQASTATLKKLPSLDFHPHLHHRTSTKQLIQSWNDGGEHRMSALPEMDDDLSYLGQLIN